MLQLVSTKLPVQFLEKGKFSIRISVGAVGIETAPRDNTKGEVLWNEMLRMDNVELPKHPVCVPDVFIYLNKNGKPICFARIPVRSNLSILLRSCIMRVP